MNELPTMLAASYGNTNQFVAQARANDWVPNNLTNFNSSPPNYAGTAAVALALNPHPKEPTVAQTKRRLVRVLVVDPSDSVPVDKCLLHAGQEQFTDATDQELFFDIDIRSILEEHNKYRVTVDDKSSKAETPKKLEPARIRDLKMVVVTLAEF